MKFLLVLFGFVIFQALLVSSGDIEDQCVQKLNLNKRELQFTSSRPDTPEDNEEYGKFYICIWKGRGVMDNNGAIVKEGVEKFLEEEVFIIPDLDKHKNKISNTVIEECVAVQDPDEGVTAVKFKNCVFKIIWKNAGY